MERVDRRGLAAPRAVGLAGLCVPAASAGCVLRPHRPLPRCRPRADVEGGVLRVGHRVHALDQHPNMQKWLEARVVEERGHGPQREVKIHYKVRGGDGAADVAAARLAP